MRLYHWIGREQAAEQTLVALAAGSPDEVPPPLRDVATLLRGVTDDGGATTIAPALLDRMVAEVRSSSRTPRRKRMIGQFLTAKVTALAVGTVLSAGSAAAAATGTLPAPAQDFVSETVAHVGVDVPTAQEHATKSQGAEHRSTEGTEHGAVPGAPVKKDDPTEHDTTTTTVAGAADARHEDESATDDHGAEATEPEHHDGGSGKSTSTTVKHEDSSGNGSSGSSGSGKSTSTTVKHEDSSGKGSGTTTTTVKTDSGSTNGSGSGSSGSGSGSGSGSSGSGESGHGGHGSDD